MNSNNNEKSIRGSSLELDEQNNLDHISLARKNVINASRMEKKAKVLEKLTSISPFLEQTQNTIDTDIEVSNIPSNVRSHGTAGTEIADTNIRENDDLEQQFALVLIIFSLSIFIGIYYISISNMKVEYTKLEMAI